MRKHLTSSLCAALSLAGIVTANAQSAFYDAVTALNPVAYWPLTETTPPPGTAPALTNLGSLGASYNATINNSVYFGVAGALPGSTDKSDGFDGISASALVPYGSGVANSPSFTVESWILCHNISATQCPLSDVDANSPRSGWLIYMDVANPGQFTFRAYAQNGTSPSLSMNIGAPGSVAQDEWTHLVIVVSNAVTTTNVYAYVNGVLATGPTAMTAFVPNDGASGTTFSIGDRSDNGFYFDGDVDEVAYYYSALDANTVAAHYNNGSSSSPSQSYSSLVEASSPALYYRMDQPAVPVATDAGSLGSVANGYYQSGTVPGSPGPSFGSFGNGFGANNYSTQFSPGDSQSGGSGPSVACATLDPSVLDFTNAITVAAWVNVPAGAVGWFEGVVGRGDSSYRMAVDTSGFPHFADGGNSDVVGATAVNDGNWHYWVGTYDPTSSNAVLYIDSVSAGTATWGAVDGNPDNPFLIGGAPDYSGRNFVGNVAQVALFTNALSHSDIQSMYNATAPSPYSFAIVGLNPLAYWPLTESAQPPAVPTFSATNLGTVGSALDATFTGDVVYGVPGALASSVDSADEFNGSTTKALLPYTADLANPPSFTIEAWLLSHNTKATQCPLSDVDANSPRSGWLIYMDISNPGQYTFRGYAQNGTSPALTFNIGAANSIQQDQWNHLVVVVSNGITVTNVYGYINGTLVAGPTALPAYVPNDGGGSFSIGARSDVSYFFDGDIDEVAYYTNALDGNTILSHYQAGTTATPPTPYSQLVLQQKPIAYFRMDEAPVGSPYPVALPVAVNYGITGAAGNGYYEPGTMPGVAGPFGANSLACAFDATVTGIPGTSGPGVLCDPYNFTILDLTNAITLSAWVEVPQGTPNFETVIGRGDGSYRFDVDASGLPHFAAAPNADLVGSAAIADGAWHLWTGVFNPTTGAADLYIDGIVQASATWSALSASELDVFIGGAPDYTGRSFTGSIAHVAILTNALTQQQIQQVYSSIGVPPSPPVIVQEPAPSDILFVGGTLTASVVVTGPGPFTYQWYVGATNAVANATGPDLSLAHLALTNSGAYTCVIANHYGSVTSSVLSLTVISTHTTAYDAAVTAYNPVAYYPLNETGGTIAYEYVSGDNGTYESNAIPGQPGVENPPFAGFPATDYAVETQNSAVGSWVSAPFGSLEGTNGETIPNLTLSCWIYPVGQQEDSTGLIFDRGGATGGLNLGAGTTSQQLSYTWNNNASDTYNFVSGLTPPQNEWSFVGLTISPSQAVLFMYTAEGRAFATNAIPHSDGILDGAWRIGNDADADPTRTFNGMIDAVAIFPSALTISQLNALFDLGAYATTNIAPVVVVPSTPITVDLGGTGKIPSTVLDGPGPYSYQWYYLSGTTTNKITGATNGVLTLTDIQSAQANDDYFVVVSNAYGATASGFATLTIISGAPTIVTDVFPAWTEVPAGLPVTLFVSVTGTEPFTYVWSKDGTAIPGATNSSYTFDALGGSNYYYVVIQNSIGSAQSSTAAVVGETNAPGLLSFNTNGTGWTFNQGAGWPGDPSFPDIVNDLLTLTDGTNGEVSSAFYDLPQYVGSFVASYTYQVAAASSVADGIAFCLEDSTNAASGLGLNALGGGGGELGVFGITPSVEFEMNVYTGANGGVGIELGTNGLTADTTPQLLPYGPTGQVNISSFDPINVQLYYFNDVMTVHLADGKLSFTTNYYCNIPATLGSDSAFIGFTGATGGVNSYQTVSNFMFSYTTEPILSVAKGTTAGTVVVSWPISVSSMFVLQQTTNLAGAWTNVSTPPVIAGGKNTVTLTRGTSDDFYRLSLE